MKISKYIALMLLAASVLGCRRDLVHCDVNYAKIEVRLDWSDFGQIPDDATVIFYPQNGDSYYRFIMHHEVETVNLKRGKYAIVVFNQKPGDFEGINFEGIDRYETIKAVVKKTGIVDPCGVLYEIPDELAVASMSLFEVTEEMIGLTQAGIDQNNEHAVTTITLKPENVVKTSLVTVYIDNLRDARKINAIITGTAGGIFLSNQTTDDNSVAQRLPELDLEFSDENLEDGKVSIPVVSFGMRSDATGIAEDVEMCLRITLVDKDKTEVEWKFPIGDKIDDAFEESSEVTIGSGEESGDDPIPLPDVEPEEGEGGGAFNPDVGDWDKEENVDIPTL